MTTETRDQGKRAGGNVEGVKPQNRKYRTVETRVVGSLAEAVDLLGVVERVYVCGRPPLADECAEIAMEAGATVYLDGHWPTFRSGGSSIRWAAQWTGSEEAGVGDTSAAFERIADDVRRSFGASAVMLATPATTGRDLWLRVAREQWPVMSEEAQNLTRATSLQGRIELFPPRSRDGLAEHIYGYDMRVAYGAVLAELPIGEPVLLGAAAAAAVAESSPYARARYRVEFEAPPGWNHVGILPAATDPRSWPLAGEGWADAVEIRLALMHGWRIGFREALQWGRKADPLAKWQAIIAGRLAAAERAEDRPLRSAWRAILIQSIGAFHGGPRRHTVIGSNPPEDAGNLRMMRNGSLAWFESRPAAWPALSHPEWSSSIWARVRGRLLSGPGGSGMLSLNPASVIACRTDGIYTTTDAPAGWPDDGALGRFRLKSHTFEVGRRWPTSAGELLREARDE